MSIGANIKKRRFELKMTQQDLANAMGYKTRTTIAKIESGENDISQTKLQRMAKIMDTTVESLLAGNNSLNLPQAFSVDDITSLNNGTKKKNIVLIMAGGKSGRNMQNIPNQFINVLNKPIIIYCLEAYQLHPSIDDIYIVCLKGWESIVQAYAEQFGITKLKGIIPAGPCGILSVKNGIDYIKNIYNRNDNIIIQEATRPMVSVEMISKLIQTVNSIGSASICRSMNDYIQFDVSNQKITYLDRNTTVDLQSPEAFTLEIICNAFNKADKKNHEYNESCCAMLLYNLGYYINFIEGSTNNLKIIRQEDISILTTLLKQKM